MARPILRRCTSVYLPDSRSVVLPDDFSHLWPGGGGSREKNTPAAVKLQVRVKMNTGGLHGPYLQAGRVHDRSSGRQHWLVQVGANL